MATVAAASGRRVFSPLIERRHNPGSHLLMHRRATLLLLSHRTQLFE